MAESKLKIRPTYNPRQDEERIVDVYMPSLLSMKIALSMTEIGQNITQNLERVISSRTQGKCIHEGFLRPNSIKILSYSSGVVNGDMVEFQTTFECMICNPVEGMLIECQTKTITKAGIHAEVVDTNGVIPITVFIARDHHLTDKIFQNVKENQTIAVRVIGSRYELNDPYICVIGKIVEQKTQQNGGKPAISIYED